MTHVNLADLDSIRRGTAPAGLAASVGQHVARCADCAAKVDQAFSVTASAAMLQAAFTIEDEHLDDDQVEAFAEGTMLAGERGAVAAHLESCSECRADVADLRGWIRRQKQRSFARYVLATAAAVAVIAFLAPQFVRDDTRRTPVTRPAPKATTTIPVPAPPPDVPRERPSELHPEWRALVERVRTTGKLPFPADLRELAAEDQFRGGETPQPAARVWPAATAVDELRPELEWPAVSGGRYVVTLTSGTDVVARSSALQEPRWRPPVALERGATYRWQVEVTRGGDVWTLPAPPAPPAVFRVVGQAHHEELARAEREVPDDHLLRGVLYAQAGVVDEARRELEQWMRASGDPAAARLLAQLPASR